MRSKWSTDLRSLYADSHIAEMSRNAAAAWASSRSAGARFVSVLTESVLSGRWREARLDRRTACLAVPRDAIGNWPEMLGFPVEFSFGRVSVLFKTVVTLPTGSFRVLARLAHAPRLTSLHGP